MGKSNIDKNKSAFDYLYKYKDDIEKEIGIALHWERSEDTKASTISYYLHDVSIKDESDWLRMAKFQAEWSKKFYDAFVPRLYDWKE